MDHSPNGLHGEIRGGLSFTPGVVGSVGSFDGKDDYVMVGEDSRLRPVQAVSVSACIRLQSYPRDWNEGCVVKNSVHRQPVGGYWMSICHVGNPKYREGLAVFNTLTTAQSGAIATVPLELNTWNHVVGTFDGTTHRLYINGSLDASSAQAPGEIKYLSDCKFSIGGKSENVRRFRGDIDEVRVYSRALSAEEIQHLYILYKK